MFYNLKKIFLNLNFFLKINYNFNNPKKTEIIVFDDESFYEIKNILKKRNFFLLPTRNYRIKNIYISINIILKIFKNYKGNLYHAYLVSLIETISPKIVLTFIPNSLQFSAVAKIMYKRLLFVAIQNASMLDTSRFKLLYKKKLISRDFSKDYFIPNLFCFGDYEIDYFTKNKVKVINFEKVGSVRLANFLDFLKRKKIKLKKNKYDLCVIPEALDSQNLLGGKKWSDSLINIIKFSIKYSKKYNCKIVFPLKRDEKKQFLGSNYINQVYKKQLTRDELSYFYQHSVKKDLSSYSSYFCVFQSNLTIGSSSTMLKERLGCGGKVLGCDFTNSKINEFPIKGICNLTGSKFNNFKSFEKRVSKILSMNSKVYFFKMQKNKDYVLKYNKNLSANSIISNKLNSIILNKN
jgi:surface carbohydrate biosynthesis protein